MNGDRYVKILIFIDFGGSQNDFLTACYCSFMVLFNMIYPFARDWRTEWRTEWKGKGMET